MPDRCAPLVHPRHRAEKYTHRIGLGEKAATSRIGGAFGLAMPVQQEIFVVDGMYRDIG